MKEKGNKKIITRIKGLLRLADDNPNDEEGQAAFILAQKLMIKHRIDEFDLGGETIGESPEDVTEEAVTIFKRLYWWERELGNIIAENFRVKIYYSNTARKTGTKRKSKIVFYGLGKDLELAKELFILAYDAVVVYEKKYVRDHRGEGYTAASLKNSYLRGYLNGLRQRFDDQVSELKGKYELVIKIPKVVEDAYAAYSAGFGEISWARPAIEVDQAFHAGQKDGLKMDFTKKHLDEGE